jgi:Bacterial PH domain
MTASQSSGGAQGNVQTFRSPTAMVIWVGWLLFAAASGIDLAVQGRDHTSVVAAALLLLATGIAYVTAQRPRIIAGDAGVTVKNPLRDHRIGWASVAKVDLADLLRVHCDLGQGAAGGQPGRKVISSWAVHHSRRRQLAAEVRSRRMPTSQRSSLRPYGRAAGSAATEEAEMIVRLLTERATAAQAETVWATGTAGAAQETDRPAPTPAVTGWLEPLTSTWSRPAIATILIPALVLLIVCLL